MFTCSRTAVRKDNVVSTLLSRIALQQCLTPKETTPFSVYYAKRWCDPPQFSLLLDGSQSPSAKYSELHDVGEPEDGRETMSSSTQDASGSIQLKSLSPQVKIVVLVQVHSQQSPPS